MNEQSKVELNETGKVIKQKLRKYNEERERETIEEILETTKSTKKNKELDVSRD